MQENIHTGTNVVMKSDCNLAGPLVLGDNTFIESKTNIVNAILGERSLVDKASTLERAIVFDRTYVAGKLETPEALEIILPKLLALGYEPVTVGELLGIG